jgi:hypothetical protein
MSAVPRELARKRSANTPARQPERRVINGHVVPDKRDGLTLFGVFAAAVLALLFAGYLLSSL